MHGLRASRNDGALELHDPERTGFFLPCPSGFFHLQVMGVEEDTVAAQRVHLAHFGHGRQAPCQLADDLVFVCAQLVKVHDGLRIGHARVRQMSHFVHDGGDMQQGFRGNATHIQAYPAQGGIAFNDDRVQSQISRTESGRVTAGATTQHQHITRHIHGAAVAARK